MKYDAGVDVQSNTVLHADVCIIGTGAAGLTLAHEFLQTRARVIVLESSRINVRQPSLPNNLSLELRGPGVPNPAHHRYEDPIAQQICKGVLRPDAGDAHDFFLSSRIRCYGGTTNCWGGWTTPLSDYDLGRRDTEFAWPEVVATDLLDVKDKTKNYFKRAMTYCSIGDPTPPENDWGVDKYRDALYWTKPGIADFELKAMALKKNTALQTSVVLRMESGNGTDIDGRLDFQHVWGPDIEASGNVAIYRNANVRKFETTPDGKSVTGLWATAIASDATDVVDGKATHDFFVSARRYVLAAGAVENARLLLNSPDIARNAPQGLGKAFVTHPLILEAAEFMSTTKVEDSVRQYYTEFTRIGRTRHPPHIVAMLEPKPETMRINHMPNFRAWLSFPKRERNDDGKPKRGTLNFLWEQTPSRDNASHVDLSTNDDDSDPIFHDRVADVTLTLAKLDTDMRDAAFNLIASELSDDAVGYIVKGSFKPTPKPPTILSGQHVLGTTRMAANDKWAVVNPDCRLLSVDNLYLAGGSVFSRGGWANPTLTIMALAVRLADHLKKLN
jgi:choline dehydrogenase-like flavoprotein